LSDLNTDHPSGEDISLVPPWEALAGTRTLAAGTQNGAGEGLDLSLGGELPEPEPRVAAQRFEVVVVPQAVYVQPAIRGMKIIQALGGEIQRDLVEEFRVPLAQ
jgi:hypothetical protein